MPQTRHMRRFQPFSAFRASPFNEDTMATVFSMGGLQEIGRARSSCTVLKSLVDGLPDSVYETPAVQRYPLLSLMKDGDVTWKLSMQQQSKLVAPRQTRSSFPGLGSYSWFASVEVAGETKVFEGAVALRPPGEDRVIAFDLAFDGLGISDDLLGQIEDTPVEDFGPLLGPCTAAVAAYKKAVDKMKVTVVVRDKEGYAMSLPMALASYAFDDEDEDDPDLFASFHDIKFAGSPLSTDTLSWSTEPEWGDMTRPCGSLIALGRQFLLTDPRTSYDDYDGEYHEGDAEWLPRTIYGWMACHGISDGKP